MIASGAGDGLNRRGKGVTMPLQGAIPLVKEAVTANDVSVDVLES